MLCWQLVEVGPFSFEFTSKKFDIEFKSGGTVHYREYQRLTFSEKHSCDECTEIYPLTTVNIGELLFVPLTVDNLADSVA